MVLDLLAKKNRWIYILSAAIIALYFALLSKLPSDLDVFIDGANKFKAGANPYAGPYVRELQYYYSPLFAMLLSFFTWIPAAILKFSWMVLILVSLLRISILFRYYFRITSSDARTQLWISIAVALSIYFIILNVRATQMTVFMVWACFESINFSNKNQPLYAGLLLGLFINFKLLLLPFMAYLLYRGYFKAAIYAIGAFILYLFIPLLYVGWQNNLALLTSWWQTINPTNQEHLMELETGRYSLSALLPIYVPEKYFKEVLLASRLFFMMLTLFFLNTKPFTSSPSRLFQFRELSYLCLVIILLFPHQGSYAFFFLAPAFSYLTYVFLFHFKEFSKLVRIISASIFITCLILLFLGKDVVPDAFYNWTFRYHLMTWAIIGMIPVLAILSPAGIKEQVIS